MRPVFVCKRWSLFFIQSISKWFPRVLMCTILTWGLLSSYPLLMKPGASWLSVIVSLSTILFFTLSQVSYWLVIYRGPGSTLDHPELLGDEELGRIPQCIQNSVLAKRDGRPRYCTKCRCWKPDRTHHCRGCEKCILKMDHHCIWFTSCVGFKNHKYFLQFLWYVDIFCFHCLGAALKYLIPFFVDSQVYNEYLSVNTVILAVIAFSLSLAVFGFAIFSTYLAVSNLTTLERMENTTYKTAVPSRSFRYREPPTLQSVGNIFDLGWSKNLSQVLGTSWSGWILPIPAKLAPESQGTSFPLNHEIHNLVEDRAQAEIELRDTAQLPR